MQFFILKDEEGLAKCSAFLKALNFTKPWSVEIKQYRKNRSGAQNRTYWAWLRVLGDEIGHSDDEMHELFRGRFLGYEEKTIMGQVVRITKSSRKLTVQDFASYLVQIEMVADSMNIRLPRPDDYAYAIRGDKQEPVGVKP